MEQSELLILAIVVVVILVALALWFGLRRRRTATLRDKFGDEYDRTVGAVGHRGKAEADLQARAKRVASLDIRPLSPQERGAFTAEWHEVKAVFVDSPPEAVLHADRMLAKMMATRGYPMADFDRRFEDLSVDHAEEARHYRAGHDLAERSLQGQASTEDLRQAMKHYEALFDHLVNDISDTVQHRPVTRPAQNS
jgi:hypothetical protein